MLHFRMDMPLHLMALYGSIMILAVCLLRIFLKNHLPKFIFPVLWSLVLVRLLIPFSISSPISAPVPDWQIPPAGNGSIYVVEDIATVVRATATEDEEVAYNFAEAAGSSLTNWKLILSIIFCLGATATTGILLYQKQCYSKKLNNSLLIEYNETINTIIREMGMGHVLIFTNDEIASPLVCGILHPRIYLPTRMNFQNIELLQHILAHETMHIKRGDNWIKTAMLVAICLNWYNPLVWFMSKYLSSDLESACDAAVLNQIDTDQRQSYARSLLSMAITGNRSTLLYSAFSKTEVERRIKNVLQYKKTTALVLALSMIFLLSSTVVFATGGQAPFSSYLSAYCVSTGCKWGVKASISRDIVLGENPQKRADNVILDILDADNTNDPAIIADNAQAALSKEFGVEKNAFKLTVSLCLNEEELEQEYAAHGITKGKDGLYLYNKEPVRYYADEMLSSVQTVDDGTVDIIVVRDRLGNIISVTACHKGDTVFDHRTKQIERNRRYFISTDIEYGTGSANQTTIR